MKRWFLAPIIGTGAKGDAYRPDISGVDWNAIIPSNSDGTPRFNWCLIKCKANDFTSADANNNLIGLPENLNAQLSTLSAAARNRIQNALTNRGVDLTGITLTSTIKDVLIRAVQALGLDVRAIDGVDL